jgi:exodeoxyribonuclease-3
MKIATWNVNGLRSAGSKGFLEWLASSEVDAACLQETKARPEQLEEGLRHPARYFSAFAPAEKPGYSGVAIYAKKEPLDVWQGLGDPEFDREGRVLGVEFKDFALVSAYFPNSQRDHARLPFKLRFCDAILKKLEALRASGKNVAICGDFNIAHREIDLKNPKANAKNAGFLPEERAWMDRFVAAGWVDAFRRFEPGPGHYTWWSYRPGVRAKNIGWRLDYFFVNPEFSERVAGARHSPRVMGSDHCPVEMSLRP